MIVRLTRRAQADVTAAIAYYESEEVGLGERFAGELGKQLKLIGQFPRAWPYYTERSRRSPVRKFPYGIGYQVRETEVVVMAVMSLARDPRLWLDRAEEGEE
jgi:plasmid stabilization system protein ParE